MSSAGVGRPVTVDPLLEQGSPWRSVNLTLRPVALLGLASLLAGVVVGGIGGRIVMTVSARVAGPDMAGRITENGNVIGEFTVAGTMALIVFVGLLGGMLASVGIVASDPWLRWMGGFKGLGFGVVVLTVYGHGTFESIDFLILHPLLLNVAMFLGLMLGFGLGVVGFVALLDRRLPKAADSEQVGWLIVVGLGTMPLLLSVLFFTSESFCGCEPAYEIGTSLLLMLLTTGVYHASAATSLIPAGLKRTAMIAGYLSLTAAVSFGAIRIVNSLQQLF